MKPQRLGGTGIEELNVLTSRIIGAAIEVHKILGPGLLESIYEAALCIEFEDRGVGYARQVRLPTYYKGRPLGKYEIDLIVEELVIVEIKSVSNLTAVFEAQLLTYLRLADKRVGLLINFNSRLLKRRNHTTRLVIECTHDAAKRRARIETAPPT
jgi:GxxExxY protein